jgi:hypothetical protein
MLMLSHPRLSDTCHTKSVITKPQNVCVMRDVMCSGYIAGGNTRFFGANLQTGVFDATGNPSAVRSQMSSRLTFEDDSSGDYGSMLAFGAPYGDGAKRDQVISITSRLLPWEVSKEEKNYFPGGQDNFEKVKDMLELDSIHYGEELRATQNQDFISQGSTNNSICFVGPHRKFNPYSKQMHELVPGQGHFGSDAIPGVSAITIEPHISHTQLRCYTASSGASSHTHTHTFYVLKSY